jgi:predicted unusual protein kinase regulating ubiquinone biosynthesis (AarF/ABC1/UbiB family)
MARLKELRTSFRSSHHQRLHTSLLKHSLTDLPTEDDKTEEPDFSPLRFALQESGDVFRLFGLYLGTRIDLLPIKGCLELTRTLATASPTPWAEAQLFVEEELGIAIDQEFLAVEPMPYETSILTDCYIAMLTTGDNVSLQVLRSEFRSFPSEQVDALNMLCDCQHFRHWADSVFRAVVEDFARELRVRIDQLENARSFEALATDAEASEGSWAPQTLRRYCRHGILALQKRASTNFSFICNHKKYSEANIRFTRRLDASPESVARSLCVSWLRAVLHGHVFPVTFRLDHIAMLEDGRIAFLGEVFASCWPDYINRVWRYLVAVAADDPDECCRLLLSMMTNTRTNDARNGQRHLDALAAFRQSVTCFMSAPGEQDFCSGMAARVLRQLQIAAELGYRPKSFLIPFYRGLFSVLSATWELQPQGDPLLEGLEGVWMTNIFGSARKTMRIDPLTDIGGKYLSAMIELPIKLDAALSNASRESDEFAEDWHAVSERDPTFVISMVILLLAAFLLVRYGPVQFASVWVDRVSFSICCLIGFLVLRLIACPW